MLFSFLRSEDAIITPDHKRFVLTRSARLIVMKEIVCAWITIFSPKGAGRAE
jgi:hypothetical protein